MSALSLNTIAESPLAAEPPPSIDYYVELQIGATSAAILARGVFSTATVELSADIQSVTSFNFVDSVSFVTFVAESDETLSNVENELVLEISANDTTSQKFVFEDSTSLLLGGSDAYNYFWNRVLAPVREVSPGIPIGPISFNAIGQEQILGFVEKFYPYLDQTELEIAATDFSIKSVSRNTTGTLEIGELDAIVLKYDFVESAGLELTLSSFVKGYTLLQQEYADDVISLGINIESIEFFGNTASVGRAAPAQVWFG